MPRVYENYVLDFDDTLAAGPMTWAIDEVLPELMERHGLPMDRARLDAALIRAQELAVHQFDDSMIIELFLNDMAWSSALQEELGRVAASGFRATLFDDTIPFLKMLRDNRKRVLVISNNVNCPLTAIELGINNYIDGFFTPRSWEGWEPKPDPSMFDAARGVVTDLRTDNTVVVGDDPWSDAAFAANCGLPCRIVDRHHRYGAVTMPDRVERIHTLRAALTGWQ